MDSLTDNPFAEFLYNNDYYDPDDFLAEEQLVPCTFKQYAPRLGPFVSHKDTNIPINAKVEAPFWLALALQEEEYIERATPKCFSRAVQSGLRACATNVNLDSLNTYFYALGKKFAHSTGAKGQETDIDMSSFLNDVFQERMKYILDKATTHGKQSAETYSFLATIDATEKQLFLDCQKAYMVMEEWEKGRSSK